MKEIKDKFSHEMVLIPGGDFWMGSPEEVGMSPEWPRHKVGIDSFFIDKYPITFTQFDRFLKETRYVNQNNSGGMTHPVGQKKPNSFGLYDMAGNVLEWCSDLIRGYDDRSFGNSPSRNMRGGSYQREADCTRSAWRWGSIPDDKYGDYGFRCAMDR
jgi:formylglycine-generating enzyme required for sulfatase activity